MSKLKKDKVVADGAEMAPEAVTDEVKTMVLSQRLGAVKTPCGKVIQYQDVVEVPESSAAWLEASFKGMFRRVK